MAVTLDLLEGGKLKADDLAEYYGRVTNHLLLSAWTTEEKGKVMRWVKSSKSSGQTPMEHSYS